MMRIGDALAAFMEQLAESLRIHNHAEFASWYEQGYEQGRQDTIDQLTGRKHE